MAVEGSISEVGKLYDIVILDKDHPMFSEEYTTKESG